MPKNAADFATGKPVDLSKPEERVRQEYEESLVFSHGYDKRHLDIEVPIQRGSAARERADIVVYRTTDQRKRSQNADISGIVEVKRDNRRDGVDQLTSYMSATSALWGVWTNGSEIEYLYKDPGSARIQSGIIFSVPHLGQSLEDIGTHTYSDLRKAIHLKVTFRRLLNELYTNTNISRREKLGGEMTKLLFCKLYDEQRGAVSRADAVPDFRVARRDADSGFSELRERVDNLFESVKDELSDEGVFDRNETILLENKSLAYVVGELQEFSLLDTDEDVVGGAFEVFAESKFAGEKGEFFTPREVVKTAIQLIDPKPGETIMDPACGSGGFLISALQHIWSVMDTGRKWANLSPAKLEDAKRNIAKTTIHGLDKENDLVKITKAYMAIIGDGKSRIAQANSLHAPDELEGAAKDVAVNGDQLRQFDVILTNPPFGSKQTKVPKTDSAKFDLGHSWSKKAGRYVKNSKKPRKTPTQELFIERCFDMLKPGGRLAIVLPETYAHAPSKKYIVDYIQRRGRVRAVIDLPHNTFRPHCNAKTLLWIVEKGRRQGAVIFGVAEEMGRDHLGKTKYRIRDGVLTDEKWDDTERIRQELHDPDADDNGHVFVVAPDAIKGNVFVPRYYWKAHDEEIEAIAEDKGLSLVRVGDLITAGIIAHFKGHGSPDNIYKGAGDIPYVRAGDIGNWSIYKNPTATVPRHVYESVKKNGVDLEPDDLILVKEGSYRTGDVAIVLPCDTEILLNSHCVVLRVADADNEHDLDGPFLAYLLSHPLTRMQVPSKVFIDTTLPNIGTRWKDLRLPIPRDRDERMRVKAEMRRIVDRRQEAEEVISQLGLRQ